jgi:hypothetical protein
MKNISRSALTVLWISIVNRFVLMKTSLPRKGSFLRYKRNIIESFLDIFRFTEADASVLLSAYGLQALEIDRLCSNRPEQPEDVSKEQINHRKRKGAPAAPILLGVHPDFIMGNWKTAGLRSTIDSIRLR